MHNDLMMAQIAQTLRTYLTDFEAQAGLICPQLRSGPNELKLLQLFEYAREVTNDDLLGLADTPCPRGSFLFRGEIAVRCSTLGEALAFAFQYITFVCSSAHFSLDVRNDEAIIEIDIVGLRNEMADLQRLWMLLTTFSLSQWLIGAKIDLHWANLPVPMEQPFGEYSRIFGSECSFNCDVGRIAFSRQVLQRRVIRSPKDFASHMRSPIGNVVNPKTLLRSWKETVKRRLQMNLDEERSISTIEALAEEFGISSQTLRRRLKAEETSFRLLKAEVRRDAALDALSKTNISLSEASLRAGFAEPNGLTRALKTSTGIGASQLRSQIRNWQGRTTQR